MIIVCKKYVYIFSTFLKLEMLLFSKQCPPNFISGKGSELIKVGEKLLCDAVIFSILSSEIPLDLNEKKWVLRVKN